MRCHSSCRGAGTTLIGAGGSGAQLPNISIAATAARVIRFMFIIVQV